MKTFTAIIASIIAGQYFWLSDTWFAYGLSLNAQVLIAWALVFYFIPYNRIVEKSAAFVFMVSYAWDIVQYLSIDGSIIAPFISVLIFVPWLLFAVYRGYDVESVKPQKDMVYKVSHKPDSFTGFILSLLLEKPTSGSGVLINDDLYIYRHGVFEKKRFGLIKKDGLVIMETGIHKDNKIISYLQSMLGKAWTPWRNCITMQFHLRSMHRARKS